MSDPLGTVLEEVGEQDRVLDMAPAAASRHPGRVAFPYVAGVDINPMPWRPVIANAERNGVAGRLTLFHSDVFEASRGAST